MTRSTKILTLAIAWFLFIFVGVICEFVMVPGVYILLSPHEEEIYYSSWGPRCTHSAAHSSKRFKPLLRHVTMLRSLLNWKKTQTRNSAVLIMRPSSFFKFQFVFGFNESLWEIFSLLDFENFWLYIWVEVVYMTFYSTTQMISSHSYPMSMNKKLQCKDHQIHITKCWEKSVKEKSNLDFIRIIKISSFDEYFLYIPMLWSKPFWKILWWCFLIPHSERLLISSATLLRRQIFQF